MHYNLMEEPWIPVLDAVGNHLFLGALELLEKASSLHGITASSPLDTFAIHRFLQTLLYWKADAAGGVSPLRESLLQGIMPPPVLEALQKEKETFDLFHDKKPFLQDLSINKEVEKSVNQKRKKSAGSFFSELATGTNIAHFQHGDDKTMRLCLRCTALGMIRLVPWSQSGGSGLSPSIHNAPPIMALAMGKNLLHTLGRNLVPLEGKAGKPQWSGHFKPTDPTGPIPYLEAFTWNPRRVRLPLPRPDGVCAYCGQQNTQTVGNPEAYEKNNLTTAQKKGEKNIPFQWQDPAAFYFSDEPFVTMKSTQESLCLGNQDIGRLVYGKKASKKEQAPLFPESIVVDTDEEGEDWQLVVPCSNPANNKTYDHRMLTLETLSQEAIRPLLPEKTEKKEKPLAGWLLPEKKETSKAALHFVQYTGLLTPAEWAVFSDAAFRNMDEAPAAFDIFSGIFWGLRQQHITPPSRKTAWIMLKLMADVPEAAKKNPTNQGFHPLALLPRHLAVKDLKKGTKHTPYPLAFPEGKLLEKMLKEIIRNHLRKRNPEPINWIGLCDDLNRLLKLR
jgi:hypothetical protein